MKQESWKDTVVVDTTNSRTVQTIAKMSMLKAVYRTRKCIIHSNTREVTKSSGFFPVQNQEDRNR